MNLSTQIPKYPNTQKGNGACLDPWVFGHLGISLHFLAAVVTLMFCAASLAAVPTNPPAGDKLIWNKLRDRVEADVRDLPLIPLLERVAAQSGWHVLVEPAPDFRASAKFKDLPSGEALRRLLNDLNYVIVPQTNAAPRLYVFRSVMQNATQTIRVESPKPRRVPRELIVRVRPGTDIEELARKLGAKVVGYIPELNAYRLQFEDGDATEAARKELAANADVTSVSDNYYVDVPDLPQSLIGMAAPDSKLKLDPPKADDCRVIVGLVDTALQPLGAQLEPFIKERISVAGEVAVDNTQPTHSTAMVNAFFQAMQSSGKTSTSVQILSVDAFGASGSANTFNVAAGMITAGNRGATVINASLGGYGDSPLLRDAVRQLASHNIPVFAAVGNDASTSAFFPAAYPEVISVTAVERGKVAAYANVGTQPDAAAPGAVVFSHNGLVYGSRGTSVSSAAATGIAAGLADSGCQPWSSVIPMVQKNLAVPAAAAK